MSDDRFAHLVPFVREDEGISGAKGNGQWPPARTPRLPIRHGHGLPVDRLGRSLQGLISLLSEFMAAHPANWSPRRKLRTST